MCIKSVIIVILIIEIVVGKHQFPVGVLFNGQNDENEIAFRAAIDRINMHERDFELKPIAKYLAEDDSFMIERAVCDVISQGVIAIFGPSSTETWITSSICNNGAIPNIIYEWKMEGLIEDRQQNSMTVNLYPDTLLLSRAYADVVRDFDWTSYTIIYESERDLIEMQDILQIHSPGDNPITVRRIDGESDDFRPFLKKIKASGESCFILHIRNELIVPFLGQAGELKMLGEYQSYLIPGLDVMSIDFGELKDMKANITAVRLVDPQSFALKTAIHDWQQLEKRQGRVYHTSPNHVKTEMILINDAVTIFAEALKNMNALDELAPLPIDCKRVKVWPKGRELMQFIKTRTAEAISGRIEFNEYGERTYFTIYVTELSENGFTDIGIWNSVTGLESDTTNEEQAKRIESKLHNKTFIVSSRIGAPFLMWKEPKDGEILEGNNRFEGYSLDLIDHIAKLLGFTYVFELAPDGKYGGYNPVTKKWDGLVKQLLEGKADLAICDLTITSARRTAVDFSSPFMTLGISILYKRAVSAPPNLFSFLSPFSLEVWLYMATAYLGVSLLLFACARMAPVDWESSHPCNADAEEVENIWTIPNATWLTMGSIMGQGCDLLPKATSTRLITGMWWFFALMMLNSYTANLAAFLTMSRMEDTIENADDLAKQSKIKYGAVLGGSTMAFFRDSNFSTYQKMWTAMESARPSVFTKSNDEGVERVMKGKRLYAYLMESTSLEYIIERNCDLQQVGGLLDYKSYGIAMPFNSPYRKSISAAVLKMGETGTLYGLKTKWWKEMHGGGKCSGQPAAVVDSAELGVDNVGGVFLCLGVGLFIAICIGCLEFLWHVKEVAVEEKLTPAEAFKEEALFAAKFWITTKPVRTSSGSESTHSKSSSKSKSKSRGGSENRSTNTNTVRQSLGNSSKSLQIDLKKKMNTVERSA